MPRDIGNRDRYSVTHLVGQRSKVALCLFRSDPTQIRIVTASATKATVSGACLILGELNPAALAISNDHVLQAYLWGYIATN